MTDEQDRGSRPVQVFFLLLLGLGIGFYLVWSLTYGTWTDVGVYTVTILLVLFGATGAFLYKPVPGDGTETDED